MFRLAGFANGDKRRRMSETGQAKQAWHARLVQGEGMKVPPALRVARCGLRASGSVRVWLLRKRCASGERVCVSGVCCCVVEEIPSCPRIGAALEYIAAASAVQL